MVKKLTFVGPKVFPYDNDDSILSLANLRETLELNKNEICKEIYIHAHGKSRGENYILIMFSEHNTKSISAVNLLSEIQKNISNEGVHIVHLLSCSGGSAQDHLSQVPGDIILCTYAKKK